jgi:hypothetical protein
MPSVRTGRSWWAADAALRALTIAYGISADGSTVVGIGKDPLGRTAAWVATLPEPSELDVFQCYGARTQKTLRKGSKAFARHEEFAVHLSDRFQDRYAVVKRVRRLCAPADENAEGIANPAAHLTCYDLKYPKRNRNRRTDRFEVSVDNRFGDDQILVVKKPKRLCVPSTKELFESAILPGDPWALGLDHFLCYAAAVPRDLGPFEPIEVSLSDQFGDSDRLVAKPESFCTAVDKNDEGILDPRSRLTCYRLESLDEESQPPPIKVDVLVSNQFGEAQPLNVRKPRAVCVPSRSEPLD